MGPAPRDHRTVTGVPDPATGQLGPWPLGVVVGLALAGLISPLIPFAAAGVAYALADQDQGTILIGAGVAHLVLALTLVAGG